MKTRRLNRTVTPCIKGMTTFTQRQRSAAQKTIPLLHLALAGAACALREQFVLEVGISGAPSTLTLSTPSEKRTTL